MRLFDLKMTLYDMLNYSCIFICSYLWSFGGKMHIWCHHKQYFALLSYKANWFHVAMGLFSNNKSQKTSKCVRTLVTHSAVPCVLFFFFWPHFDIICNLLLNSCMATRNLFDSSNIMISSGSDFHVRQILTPHFHWIQNVENPMPLLGSL